jgi:cobalt/nickel transport system ATP-binding protein
VSHHFVDFKNVVFRYPDGTEALNGVSFRITHGESVGIVGSNGAGKSTMLLHMNGYLMPTAGTVTIGDLQLTRKTQQEIRRKVGIIFQNPDDQLFMPTVQDDVAFGPLNLGMTPEQVQERVTEALTAVNSLALRDKPPHHLSGGQKSAVAIASVLAMDPDILVMDEPAANLDPRSRRTLINLLKGFVHTKIIASHDLDMILDVCNRCIVIRNGTVVADGPSKEILSNKALMEENNLELPLSLQRRESSAAGRTAGTSEGRQPETQVSDQPWVTRSHEYSHEQEHEHVHGNDHTHEHTHDDDHRTDGHTHAGQRKGQHKHSH